MFKNKKILIIVIAVVFLSSIAAVLVISFTAKRLGDFEIKFSPAEQVSNSTMPTYRWTKSANATHYLVTISENDNLKNPLIENYSLSENVLFSPCVLRYNTKYFLSVVAVRDKQTKSTQVKSFITIKASEYKNLSLKDSMKLVDDFETYENTDLLNKVYTHHLAGDKMEQSLDIKKGSSSKSLKLDYDVSTLAWAGTSRELYKSDKMWIGATGIKFYLNSDGSGNDFVIQIDERSQEQWQAKITMNKKGGSLVEIPFSAFSARGYGDKILSLDGINRIEIVVTGKGKGTIYVDDIFVGNFTNDTRRNFEDKVINAVYAKDLIDDFQAYNTNKEIQKVYGAEAILADKQGQNSSKGLKIVYKGSEWKSVNRSFDKDNANWSKNSYINFFVNTAKQPVKLSIQLLETSGELWNSDVDLLANNGGFISISFDSFKVSKEYSYNSDEVLDKTSIQRLTIGINSLVDGIIFIDNIRLSPKKEDSQTVNATDLLPLIDSFSYYENDDELKRIYNNTGISLKVSSGQKSLKLTTNKDGWDSIFKTLSFKDISQYNYISVKVTSSQATTVRFQLFSNSNQNVSDASKLIGAQKSEQVVFKLSEFSLVKNSLGPVDLKKIEMFKIGFQDTYGALIEIDDIELLKEYTPPSLPTQQPLIENFELIDESKLKTDYNNQNLTLSTQQEALNGQKSMKWTTNQDGWDSFYKSADTKDWSKYKYLSFTVNPSANCNVYFQIFSDDNANIASENILVAANVQKNLVFEFAKMPMAQGSTLNTSAISIIKIGIANTYGATVLIDDIELLETYTPPVLPIQDSIVDNFEDYLDTAAIQAAYGNNANVTLLTGNALSGTKSLSFNTDNTGWCSFYNSFPGKDWSTYKKISFKIKSNQAGNVYFQIFSDNNSNISQSYKPITADTEMTIELNLSDFTVAQGAGANLSNISVFNVGLHNTYGATVIVDDIKLIKE